MILASLLFIPLFRVLFASLPLHLPYRADARTQLYEQIQDCTNLVANTFAKSIVVGRKQYDRFIFNNAALYFTRPDLNLATKYMSDEPGLQNSCVYGQKIAEELGGVQKPMLALLEEGEQIMEANATKTMKSCGKIEHFFSSHAYKTVGNCKSFGNTYEIRVYE
jgi:hypothetical protein